MVSKEIQIVAFNNPYPPDFGGAIDIYYKVKALSALGVKVYLHIYYDDRKDISVLDALCEKIYLYKKNTSYFKHFSLIPYAINSRFSKTIINNLEAIDAPIIFESIRTTSVLLNYKFKQKVAVRCHNIEHEYSWGLFKSEQKWFKKIAFLLEGFKLKRFESVLNNADVLFPISFHEYSYFFEKFKPKTIYLPVFQKDNVISSQPGKGKYALYHGDLSISDNIRSALFIISIFKDLKCPLIIASSIKAAKVINEMKRYNNISFHFITDEYQLKTLISEAHINTLYSFQRSGTKLKVFNALFNGRHCVLNKNMIDDLDVLKICNVAENKLEYKKSVEELFRIEFEVTQERLNVLHKYNSKQNAEIIIKEMF